LAEGDPAVSRTDGLNLEYTQGAIYAGLGYERNKGGPASAATNGDGASMVNAAFSYNFGFIRPMAYFAVAKGMDGFNLTTFAARPDQKNTMWNVGFTAPAGIGVIKAVYGVRTYEQYVYNVTNDSIEQTKLGLGYDYFLSKRTRLYADYTRNTEDRKTNNTAYALGVRHDF
jgi:predicted porin